MATEDQLSARLDELETALRTPMRHRRPWEGTGRLLASRAFEFRRSIEAVPEYPASAMVIIRALADLTILTLWIELCPKLHTVLWAAEGDRLALRDGDALAELSTVRGIPLPTGAIPSPEARGRIERANGRYRRIARKAGIRISTKPGDPLVPPVRERVRLLPISELELYDVAFATVSAWAHSASHTMALEIVVGAEGLQIVPRSTVRPYTTRRFAIALQAGQFAAISRMAGLGIEAELDLIRRVAMWAGAPSDTGGTGRPAEPERPGGVS
jgi:hypothetical protein